MLLFACKQEPLTLSPIIEDHRVNTNIDTSKNTGGEGYSFTCDTNVIYFSQDSLPILVSNGTNNLYVTGGYNDVGSHQDSMPPSPSSPLSPVMIIKIQKWMMQGAMDTTSVNSGCDNINVSFAVKTWPLINNKYKGCHIGYTPGGGILFIDYSSVAATATNRKLMGSLTDAATYNSISKNDVRLSNCKLEIIQNRIAKGIQNN